MVAREPGRERALLAPWRLIQALFDPQRRGAIEAALSPERRGDAATRRAFAEEDRESNLRTLRWLAGVLLLIHLLAIQGSLRGDETDPHLVTWKIWGASINAALLLFVLGVGVVAWRGAPGVLGDVLGDVMGAGYVFGTAAISANAQRAHPNLNVYLVGAFFTAFLLRGRTRVHGAALLAGTALVLAAMVRFRPSSITRAADMLALLSGFALALVGRYFARAIRFQELAGRRRVEALNRELLVANEALLYAKDAAEAASRAKSAFIANMSHEIRTPMNAILGNTQLLQRDPTLRPGQRSNVDAIGSAGEHLLGLINDVLEVSKIEAGHVAQSRDVVNLAALLDDLAQMFRLRAEAKQLRFEVEIDPGVPAGIVSDEGKLRQVLVNLLGNAIKFTARGGVTARLCTRPGTGDQPLLVVDVEDTGPGLTAAEIAGLFQPFSQAHAGQQTSNGTGLGLVISREFARLLGGDVTVSSQVGEGSVFRLQIPLQVDATPVAAHADSRAPQRTETPLRREPQPPTSATTAALPPEVAERLRDAARIADYDQVMVLIGALPEKHAAAAEELRALARSFAYDKIEQALRG